MNQALVAAAVISDGPERTISLQHDYKAMRCCTHPRYPEIDVIQFLVKCG